MVDFTVAEETELGFVSRDWISPNIFPVHIMSFSPIRKKQSCDNLLAILVC